MSSKSPSQIKVGDRVRCTADSADAFEMGIVSTALFGKLGRVNALDGEWAEVRFDDFWFNIRLRYLVNAELLPTAAEQPAEPAPSEQKPNEVEEAVIDQIRKRRDAGRSKYGTTMERTDLSILQWVQHAQEEAMDFSIYLEKLKRVLKEKGIE